MKISRYPCPIAVSVALAITLVLASADEPAKPSSEKPELNAKQMAEIEMWSKAGTPGPEHKRLEYMLGRWEVTGKSWSDQDAPAEEITATSICRLALGGRFIHQEYSGQMLGQPFEGIGFTGYDNIAKKYVGVWMDSYSTGVMVMTGEYDESRKQFTFVGEFPSPDGEKIRIRQVIDVVSPEEHRLTFYETRKDQPERKLMELVYTRSRAAEANAPR